MNNKKDLKDIFPEPPESFHDKVVTTLYNLPEEKESVNMKNKSIFGKIPFKKGISIAAIAVVALGTTVFAVGKIASVTGHSSIIPTYYNMPSNQKIKQDFGFDAKLVEEFDNGYKFKSGHKVENEGYSKSGESLGKFNSLDLVYKNGKETLDLSIEKENKNYDSEYEDKNKKSEGNYNGTEVYYTQYVNKFVPGDYEMTEQDKKDEAEGKYVFSFGSEEIETVEAKHVQWTQDGVSYIITSMDNDITEYELVKMAHQVIDSAM